MEDAVAAARNATMTWVTLATVVLGAVLELKRSDGQASRIEFGAGPGGADAALYGDALSINSTVTFNAPNVLAMAARLEALEIIVAQQQEILQHLKSSTDVNENSVLTINAPVVMSAGLELSGPFNATTSDQRRRLQEETENGSAKEFLRIKDGIDGPTKVSITAREVAMHHESTSQATTVLTSAGLTGYAADEENGMPKLKFQLSNGRVKVDEKRRASGLEAEEATAKAPPEFMPIFTAFRDDGTAALELDAPNASDADGSRAVLRTLAKDDGFAPHSVIELGAASREAKESGMSQHPDLALYGGLVEDESMPGKKLDAKMMQLDVPAALKPSGPGRRLNETASDLTGHSDEVRAGWGARGARLATRAPTCMCRWRGVRAWSLMGGLLADGARVRLWLVLADRVTVQQQDWQADDGADGGRGEGLLVANE